MSDKDLHRAAFELEEAADALESLEFGDVPEYEAANVCNLRSKMRGYANDLRDRTGGEDA